MAGGLIEASFGEDDSEELHFRDTVKGGAYLCNQRLTQTLVNEIKSRIFDLESYGVAFLREIPSKFKLVSSGGTCVIELNGQSVMACKELLEEGREFVVEPLGSLPIIRDLVVDREPLLEELRRVVPFNGLSAEGFSEEWQPRKIALELIPWIKQTEQRAECFLCTAVCPAHQSVPGYAGPMSFNKMARYALDSRDRGNRVAEAEAGRIYSCKSCFRCEEICPNEIPIRSVSMGSVMRFSRVQAGFLYHVSGDGASRAGSCFSPTPWALKRNARSERA